MSGERPGGGSKASEDGKGKGKEASAPSIKKEAKVEDSTGTEKTAGAPKKEEDPVKELVQEAAGLFFTFSAGIWVEEGSGQLT